MNSRQAQQMMRKMGLNQEELDVNEVIFKFEDKQLVFRNPSVTAMNMMGQKMYQVTGEPVEESYESSLDITEDDIQTVVDQTHVSKEEALTAIENANGDLAEAILSLTK